MRITVAICILHAIAVHWNIRSYNRILLSLESAYKGVYMLSLVEAEKGTLVSTKIVFY